MKGNSAIGLFLITVFFFRPTTDSLLWTIFPTVIICDVQLFLCDVQLFLCNVQLFLCDEQLFLCDVQLFYMWCTIIFMWCTIIFMWCTIIFMWCTIIFNFYVLYNYLYVMYNYFVQKMLEVLRKGTKWHQTTWVVDGETVDVPHFVSWVGPCDYKDRGLVLPKNDSWRPEIVDLLHRLMQYTERQYNSCYLSLYRNGRHCSPWACHDHPALREKPVVAIVSLGGYYSNE